MKEVYLVSCCRTAVGTFGGSLKDTPAVELGAIVAKAALERAGLTPDKLDEVMFGCVITAGLGQNVARQVAIKAGVPVEIPAYAINMVCGSGMKSVIEAARAIKSGDADVILAGGTENMSAAPYVVNSARFGARMNDGLWEVFNNYHMGITAENVAAQWNISREAQDEFSLKTQEKAAAAIASGRFDDEIVPVPIKVKKDTVMFKTDEHPRATSKDALAKLKPAFKGDGSVTAGNASGINDGAAAIVLASGEAVKKYGLKPIMKLVAWGQGGVDPKIMGLGPVAATRDAMKKSGLTIKDFDLIELNEAFAAQSLACIHDLELTEMMDKINVNGGAIALGHPVGASGARIIVTLVHEMLKRPDAKRGLASLCIGGGMGVATIWEKV